MMRKSHIAIGLVGALIINQQVGAPVALVMVGAGAGSVLPDFDLRLGIPHRGITHWIIWPFLVWFLLGWHGLALGLAIGWALHILADCFTVEGLRPLWPVQIRLAGFIRTGTFTEYLIVIPALLSLFYRYLM